jgi:hypothetical protein
MQRIEFGGLFGGERNSSSNLDGSKERVRDAYVLGARESLTIDRRCAADGREVMLPESPTSALRSDDAAGARLLLKRRMYTAR